MTALAPKTREEVRAERTGCRLERGQLLAAALWPKREDNLGTLGRTCDAVGATLVVPDAPYARSAVRAGNTLGDAGCPVLRVRGVLDWLVAEREAGSHLLGVELAHGATPLHELPPATGRTVVVLGNEGGGIPRAAWPLLHAAVEIPMLGAGGSLNVAVAGSLVLYKLAGLT